MLWQKVKDGTVTLEVTPAQQKVNQQRAAIKAKDGTGIPWAMPEQQKARKKMAG
jgi:hypothetical protein